MKAMILAAGLGTRLKPFTNNHPKALAQINGKSLLERNINYLHAFGITEIIINVHHFASQISAAIDLINSHDIKLSISDESNEVLETGGGLLKASWFFEKDEDSFILMNVDILTDLDLEKIVETHIISKSLATLAVSDRMSSRYFLFDENQHLCGWENTATQQKILTTSSTDYTRKAFSGLHIISPVIFDYMTRTGKFSMVDVYLDLSKNHKILGYDQGDCKFLDVGKPESIALAEAMFY